MSEENLCGRISRCDMYKNNYVTEEFIEKFCNKNGCYVTPPGETYMDRKYCPHMLALGTVESFCSAGPNS